MSDGREFQRMAAATGNERRPADTRRCGGTCSWYDVDEQLMNTDGGDQAGRQDEPADHHIAVTVFNVTLLVACEFAGFVCRSTVASGRDAVRLLIDKSIALFE